MIDVNHTGVLRFYVSLLAVCGALAVGCGGGDDDGGDDESSGSAGAGGRTAGTGGATGAAGMAGSTSTGSSGATGGGGSGAGGSGSTVAPVPCGSTMCQPGTSRFVRPCCFDMAAGKCGTTIPFGGSMMCNENVEADPRCESVMSRVGQIPSCCTEDNRCGISFAMFGMPGCTSLEEAAMIAMGDGGMPDDGMGGSGGSGGSGGGSNPIAVDLPAPKACE